MEATLTLIEKTAYLKNSNILSAMPIEGLAQLAAHAREIHLEEGEFAYRQGDLNRGVFHVVDGLVEVGQDSAIHTLRTGGEGFGELSLAEGETHHTFARALTHTHVLNVSNEEMFETILDFPEVGLALLRFMSVRVIETGRRVVYLEEQIAKLNRILRSHGIEVPPDPVPEPGAPAPAGTSRAAG